MGNRMPSNIFKEISQIINKRQDLSPTEKSSLQTIIHHYETDYLNQQKIISTIKMETDMPGLKEEAHKKQQNDVKDFQDSINQSIREFGVEHPELMDSITQLCTTLSNMGI